MQCCKHFSVPGPSADIPVEEFSGKVGAVSLYSGRALPAEDAAVRLPRQAVGGRTEGRGGEGEDPREVPRGGQKSRRRPVVRRTLGALPPAIRSLPHAVDAGPGGSGGVESEGREAGLGGRGCLPLPRRRRRRHRHLRRVRAHPAEVRGREAAGEGHQAPREGARGALRAREGLDHEAHVHRQRLRGAQAAGQGLRPHREAVGGQGRRGGRQGGRQGSRRPEAGRQEAGLQVARRQGASQQEEGQRQGAGRQEVGEEVHRRPVGRPGRATGRRAAARASEQSQG
mmetsp:Transcript_64775/g.168486  ORF Transcript_64775/g.168486 Transcript_64775/m.168486 type:complete len:284 (-) Transcript_64775:260-1111(-)